MESSAIDSQADMASAIKLSTADDPDYDPLAARQLFEQKCSQCHSQTQVEKAPPETRAEVVALARRMVTNGLRANGAELGAIIRFLTATYATRTAESVPQSENPRASNLDSQQAAGRTYYSQRFCIGCHGPAGKAPVTEDYPVLAGQSAKYLIRQFKDIRSGARKNGITATMSALVQNVSDEEITAIAAYLTAQR